MKYVGKFAQEYEPQVVVVHGMTEHELPHHVVHSPDGFAWGYGGSGPHDLALALLAHVLDVDPEEIDPLAAHLCCLEVVAEFPWEEPFMLDADDLIAWVDSKKYGPLNEGVAR